jgi:hypothetical protein
MRKSISVETNDPIQPEHSLLVRGFVKKLYTISHRSVTLRGPVGGNITNVITIVPEEEYRFRITEATMESGTHVRLTWKAYQAKSGTAYRIRATNLKKEKGRYFDTMRLKTDSTIQPEVRVSVYGNIQDPG